MRSAPLRLSLLSLLLSSLLTACGGGGPPTPSLLGGGIGGTGKPGLRVGPIQEETAVVVDGVTFDASAATITVSGQPATLDDMHTGMVASVAGTIDGSVGVADTVEVEELLEGRVEALIDASTIIVLGQRVQVDADTTYGPGITPPTLATIQVDDLLKIYGFVKSPGVVFATRIEWEDHLAETSLLGFVTDLDTPAQTFKIGAHVVDYSAADTSALPGGEPADGQLVKVTGLAALSAQDEVVATEVRPEEPAAPSSPDAPDPIEDVHVEGFVTSIVSGSSFFVGVQRVDTTAATVYEGGTAAEVVAGVRIQAEGSLQAGILTAGTVRFEEEAKLEAVIATIDGGVLTLEGLPGVSVTVDAATSYEGGLQGVASLVSGMRVEIRGNVTGATTVAAARIKQEDGDGVRIQGPIDASPATVDPRLHVLGVEIDTAGLPDDAFDAEDGAGQSRVAFFAKAHAGILVKADGTSSNGAVTWHEFELGQD